MALSGINSVSGFTNLGKHIGIKDKSKKLDLAVIYSSTLCNAAGMFTKNKVSGAPVKITQEHIKGGKAQAIIINSGIANVCTGKRGMEDAIEMCSLAAEELGIKPNNVLVASTGLIGAHLPMEVIRLGVKGIKAELSDKGNAAEAIMTTDNFKKEFAARVGSCTIGAIAKGAGMINPNMATMLCFIATDADFSSDELKDMLKKSVDKSFNMLSVDMDTSTSDMAILMANGLAGKADKGEFQNALDSVCIELAKMIAMDGEGATKLIIANVANAKTQREAKILAKSIVASNLVKCAAFGNDPNWGRIMAAMGSAGIEIDENKVDISFGDYAMVNNGIGIEFDKKKASSIMKSKELVINVDLKSGEKKASAYGCDMTYDYVKLNSEYHT